MYIVIYVFYHSTAGLVFGEELEEGRREGEFGRLCPLP
jgi:hypothetical protein